MDLEQPARALQADARRTATTYLREQFPGSRVVTIKRSGDIVDGALRHHQLPGEIFRIEAHDRRFDVGFTDAYLDANQAHLHDALTRDDVAGKVRASSLKKRLWFRGDRTTVERDLGKAPS